MQTLVLLVTQTNLVGLALGGFLRLGLLLDQTCFHHGLGGLGVPLGLGHPELLQLSADQLHLDGLVDLGIAAFHRHQTLDVEPRQIAVAGVLAILDTHQGEIGSLGGLGLGGEGFHADGVVSDEIPVGHLGDECLDVGGHHGDGIFDHVGLGLVGCLAEVGLGAAVGGVIVDAPIGGMLSHELAEVLTDGGLGAVRIGPEPSVLHPDGGNVLVGTEEVCDEVAVAVHLDGQLIRTYEFGGVGGGVGGVGLHGILRVWPIGLGGCGRYPISEPRGLCPSRHNHYNTARGALSRGERQRSGNNPLYLYTNI